MSKQGFAASLADFKARLAEARALLQAEKASELDAEVDGQPIDQLDEAGQHLYVQLSSEIEDVMAKVEQLQKLMTG